MRVFVLYASKFREWPLAIAQRLRQRIPDSSFCGLVAGHRGVYERIASFNDPPVQPLYYLDKLERQWLSTPVPSGRLEECQALFGHDALQRILISDREVGQGFVSGGRTVPTRLTLAARDENNEIPRRYLVGLLEFLLTTLERERPDLVFVYVISNAPGAALAVVAEHIGIPFLSLSPARIGSRYVLDDSPQALLSPVRKAFEAGLNDPTTLSPYFSEAVQFLSDFRARPQLPDYAQSNQKRWEHAYSWRGLARESLRSARILAVNLVSSRSRILRKPTTWHHVVFQLSFRYRAIQLVRKWPYHTLGALRERQFLYYPLHVDPEASTMVLSPWHTDQLAVVEALAKSMPAGMSLVVKEHQPMMGKRPSGFYDRLARMPGVLLVSAHVDGFSLIRNAAATCVITGTAAWEAMLLGKPALIIGNSPYLALDQGFEYCPNLAQLSEAIPRAMRTAPADDDRLVLYLAALLAESFDFPSTVYWGHVTRHTIEEHGEILDHICGELLRFSVK